MFVASFQEELFADLITQSEQEERRRLEGVIRSLRKEQGAGSPATLAPPSSSRIVTS